MYKKKNFRFYIEIRKKNNDYSQQCKHYKTFR